MTRASANPRERFTRLAAMVRLEQTRLAQVVAEAEQALTDFASSTPALRDLRGIGDIVHDFYTGTEQIFERIAPELNGGVPKGTSWHRDLLQSMTLDLPGIRPGLLSAHTAHDLEEFLRFRHLFRNLYGFELEWSRLLPLLKRLSGVWQALHSDLERFLEFLERMARET